MAVARSVRRRLATGLAVTAAAGGLLLASGASAAQAQPVRAARESQSALPARPAAPGSGTHDIDKQCLNVSVTGGPPGTVCVMLHVREGLRSDEFWPKVSFTINTGTLAKISVSDLYLLVCETDPATGSTSCSPVNSERVVAHPKPGSRSADIQGSTGYTPTPGVPISIGGAVAIESCLTGRSGGSAACFPGYGCSSGTPRIQCQTDPLIFSDSLAAFQATRNRACAGDLPDCEKHGNSHGKKLDWSSDGCSLPMPVKKYGQNPFGWPYRQACERHDFGYRNYIEQKRCTNSPNGGTRKLIDQVFLADLRGICAHVKARKRCNALAAVYYNAVRRFGHC